MDSKADDDLLGGDEFDAGDETEELYLEASGSAEEVEFDGVCGAIEEILLTDEEFLSTQKRFCDEHCRIFEDVDENKVEYTGLFTEYTTLMERTLEERLADKVPGFSMRRFETQLIDRKDEIGGEIFDLLLSFSDFDEFKQMMVAHKASLQGADGPGGLSVTGKQLPSAAGGGLSVGGLSVGGLSIGGLSLSGTGVGKR